MANEPDTLLSLMDEAAEALIGLVKDDDPTLALTLRPTVSEKIKTFEALTDYMKYREKPVGSAPTKSKFASMQERFNGNGGSDKTKGRGGRGGKTVEPDADDSASGSASN